MTYRPKRTRKDNNHAAMVTELRQLGAVVFDTADIGGRVLDTIVCWGGRCLPVEIKSPGKRADLTEGERECIADLERVGVAAVVAESTEEVMRAFGLLWEASDN